MMLLLLAVVLTSGAHAEKVKYILIWTSPHDTPFSDMGFGQRAFQDRKCPYSNCYVTTDVNYRGDYTKFDAIAFSPQVGRMSKQELPQRRSPRQKYIFTSDEPATNLPICDENFDHFFNWTWTYKLSSDAKMNYVVIRDHKRAVIGPKEKMHWVHKKIMLPPPVELQNTLRNKTKAAAWFLSNCKSTDAKLFADSLQTVLRTKYNLTLDIYGECGPTKCDNRALCDEVIKKYYYFYLSFEDSISEDYVTEKLVHAVRYNAIPIVFGGANYSRFMPNGSYLNARQLGVVKLAKIMNELSNNFDKYVGYHKWKRYYSYHTSMESSETDSVCGLCALLNNEKKLKKKSCYKKFRSWWNPFGGCHYQSSAPPVIKHRTQDITLSVTSNTNLTRRQST